MAQHATTVVSGHKRVLEGFQDGRRSRRNVASVERETSVCAVSLYRTVLSRTLPRGSRSRQCATDARAHNDLDTLRHLPSLHRPCSLMKAIAICALLSGLAGAVDVYLYPASMITPSLSVSQAGAALSRHLGLEHYEPLGDDVDTNDGLGRQEAFVGRGAGNALLVGVYEEDVQGRCLGVLREEQLADNL